MSVSMLPAEEVVTKRTWTTSNMRHCLRRRSALTVPPQRAQRADIWKHVRRIAKHDVPDKSAKFGYLPMMAVATLGALNAESFC